MPFVIHKGVGGVAEQLQKNCMVKSEPIAKPYSKRCFTLLSTAVHLLDLSEQVSALLLFPSVYISKHAFIPTDKFADVPYKK